MRNRKTKNLSGKRVLITGAASGIGRATALAAAAEGAELYLTDLRQPAVDAVAAEIRKAGGEVAFAGAADVADLAEVKALGERIHAIAASMDVVMNVAGIAAWGTVDRFEHRQWRALIEVNLMGPIHIIETFVPPMIKARRGGHLVNVASAAALIGLPWHAGYSASKFGLRGVSEVLRFDLRQHRIGVSLVCPGGVDTPLTDTIEIAGVDKGGRAFTSMQAHFRRRAVSPERAAHAILRGVKKGTYLVYTSNDIRWIYLLQRYFPPLYVVTMRAMNLAMRRALPASRS